MRTFCLFLYYAIAQHLPARPMPAWELGDSLRRFLVKRIFAVCGEGVIVRDHAYFGHGGTLRVGNHAMIGTNSRIDRDVSIGDDVVMGPDVVIMTISHKFESPEIPVNLQGSTVRKPVCIGKDVWIGTRVIILPGVNLGDGCVIGAGSVVTKSIPPLSVAVGIPARVIRERGERQ